MIDGLEHCVAAPKQIKSARGAGGVWLWPPAASLSQEQFTIAPALRFSVDVDGEPLTLLSTAPPDLLPR